MISDKICVLTISRVPFKSNMYLIFRWGTTRKRPSWSKRWTPRRGCSWCIGRTRAGSWNWRRTQTSRRSLKRFHNFLLLSVIWEERLMILHGESWLLFTFLAARSYQMTPSSTGLTSTSRQHKSALMHIGTFTSDLRKTPTMTVLKTHQWVTL